MGPPPLNKTEREASASSVTATPVLPGDLVVSTRGVRYHLLLTTIDDYHTPLWAGRCVAGGS